MPDYPWYQEVPGADPLVQGDIIDTCPVLVFDRALEIRDLGDEAAAVEALRNAAAVQSVRAIVMTQSCDLEHLRVRNVVLCPIYHLADYKRDWERDREAAGSGQGVGRNRFEGHTKDIKAGRIWNLAMLKGRTATGSENSIDDQIVDFHEVFSVPLKLLTQWLALTNRSRFRLLPPYREHLSQAFARFFMRVALPEEF